MANEIELKLSILPQHHGLLRKHSLLARHQACAPSCKDLINIYYDTPQKHFHRQNIALRIRGDGQRYIQTLKTKGKSEGGLHQRREWEWFLDNPELDASLIPWQALPQDMAPHFPELEALFRTDFCRYQWDLQLAQDNLLFTDTSNRELLARQGGSVESFNFSQREVFVEIVLDIGQVIGKNGVVPISEIEIELKQGEPEDLFVIAESLAQDIPLIGNHVSKAQTGYSLSDGSQSLSSQSKELPKSPKAFMVAYLQQQIKAFQRCWWQWISEGNPQAFAAAWQALVNINLSLLWSGSGVSRNQVAPIRQELERLLRLLAKDRWRLEGDSDQIDYRHHAEHTAIGVFSIRMSAFLHQLAQQEAKSSAMTQDWIRPFELAYQCLSKRPVQSQWHDAAERHNRLAYMHSLSELANPELASRFVLQLDDLLRQNAKLLTVLRNDKVPASWPYRASPKVTMRSDGEHKKDSATHIGKELQQKMDELQKYIYWR